VDTHVVCLGFSSCVFGGLYARGDGKYAFHVRR
jgi:hypothetical protein